MLLLDLSHTSHSHARTGVQRVSLELRRALRAKFEVQEITHDPYTRTWRPLQNWEQANLDRNVRPGKKRGASWPFSAQLRGWWQHRTAPRSPIQDIPSPAQAIIFPEVFTTKTAAQLPNLFSAIPAPKIAVFHDAIALRLPELSPPGTVARFPAYLEELRQFDGIAAVSEDSRQSLLDYWQWAGWGSGPEVIALPLGCDHLSSHDTPAATTNSRILPRVLSVGSIEGRKNHLTLVNACEKLWSRGQEFELELIGGLQRETGLTAMHRIQSLQREGRPLFYRGWVSDAALHEAYASAAFTVYPSIMEGFGLPVWESLRHGKPCVCSSTGAVAETAHGGGCVMTNTLDPDSLAEAISTLLSDQTELSLLTETARARRPNRWQDYAERMERWIQTLATPVKTG
jgi:glycosyltransferase involved in cell wall biosynthesis